MEAGAFVVIEGVTCRFGGITALDDVTLCVPVATLQGLVGPNGAGKTTLLRVIAGVVRPAAGRVLVDGRVPHATPASVLARFVAVLPQHPVAPVGVTVWEAVSWGRLPHLGRLARPGPTDLRAIDRALAATGTLELADRPLRSLSGGERQRVFVARALAQEPRVLLLDEPTAHLDLAHQIEVMGVLRLLARDGLVVVVAVHDVSLAAEYCDRLALLARGRLLACGPPAQVLRTGHIREAYGEAAAARLGSGRRP